MPDIVKGHTFVGGEVVEAQSLNDLVENAVIQPTFVSEKVLKDPAAMSDRILIEDGGSLKGITIQQIIDLVTPTIRNQAVPVGTVCDFAGTSEPVNWMFCYGQLVDRDEFADLFAVLGTTYSAGDGSLTFGLPDYRSCVLAGRSNMGGTNNGLLPINISSTALGSRGGEGSHTLSAAEMPTHNHSASTSSLAPMYTVANENGTYGLTVNSAFAGRVYITAGYVTAVQSTTSIGTAGSGSSHNNLQPTMIANKIIKVLNA